MVFYRHFLASTILSVTSISAAHAASDTGHKTPGHEVKASCSPDEALERLLDGNKRYVENRFELCRDTTAQLRDELAKGQHPFAIIVSCSDSRLPPEVIFDKKPGEIFVVRVAGNTVDPIGLASIEYGVEHLGASLILVLGHERCGAMTAAYETFATKGSAKSKHDNDDDEEKTERSSKKISNMETLLSLLKPGVTNAIAKVKGAKLSKSEMVELAVDENIREVAKNLLKKSPAIRKMVEADKVRIATAKFDLDEGTVKLMGRKQCTWVVD
jgi:carbonic anhydrase